MIFLLKSAIKIHSSLYIQGYSIAKLSFFLYFLKQLVINRDLIHFKEMSMIAYFMIELLNGCLRWVLSTELWTYSSQVSYYIVGAWPVLFNEPKHFLQHYLDINFLVVLFIEFIKFLSFKKYKLMLLIFAFGFQNFLKKSS